MSALVGEDLDFNSASRVLNLPAPSDDAEPARKVDLGTVIQETSGPTTLAVGAVADGQYLKRSGSTVVGDTPDGGTGGTTDWNARNETGSTLAKGTPVYGVSYDSGDGKMLIGAADGNYLAKSEVFGLVKTAITTAANGDVVTWGELSGIDTSAWTALTPLYAVGGVLSSIPGLYARKIAVVLYSHATDGIVYVFPSNPVFQLGTGNGSRFYVGGKTLAADDSEILVEGLSFDRFDYFEILYTQMEVLAGDGTSIEFAYRSGGADVAGNYASHVLYRRLDGALTSSAVSYSGTNSSVFINNIGGDTNEGVKKAKITLYPTQAGDVFSQYWGIKWNGSSQLFSENGELWCDAADEIDGIRLFPDAGNIVAGASCQIWGIKGS